MPDPTTPLENFGVLRIGSASAYQASLPDLQYEVLAAGDLNSDGHDDIVLGARFASDPPTGGENKVVVLFFDPMSRTFAPDAAQQTALQYSQYPRRAAIADFNGDGRNDLFIADTGTDDGSVVGYSNKMYVQLPQGLVPAVIEGGELRDFSHGIVVDDFNKDGVQDILVLNTPLARSIDGSTSSSYVITARADGTLSRKFISIVGSQDLHFLPQAPSRADLTPAQKLEQTEYLSGFSDDLNGDGIPDLLLTTERVNGNGELVIYESLGIGTYGNRVVVPGPLEYLRVKAYAAWPNIKLVPTEARTFDIDQDGDDELVVAYSHKDNSWNFGWQGLYFQALDRAPSGQWVDITEQAFPTQYLFDALTTPSTRVSRWPHSRLHELDLDGDAVPDLLVTSAGGATGREIGTSAAYWTLSAGQFSMWQPPGVELINDIGSWPIPATLNGQTYVLTLGYKWSAEQQRYLEQREHLSVHGWNTGSASASPPAGPVFGQDVVGTPQDDVLTSVGGDNAFFGGDGVDLVRYFDRRTGHELRVEDGVIVVRNLPASGAAAGFLQPHDGVDRLHAIERVQFLDVAVAFDLDANAGEAARWLTATLGKAALGNKVYAGVALSLFDQGLARDQISQIALDFLFGRNPSSVEVVRLLWKNLVGTEIDAANLAAYSGLIDSGAMTAAQLTTMAAELELAAQVAGLVGLSETGWDYVPVGG